MITGHGTIITYLTNIARNRNPSSAYLFYGPAHVGKSTTALWFAKALMCEQFTTDPCEKCVHCAQIQKKRHPDVFMVELEEGLQTLSIAQIRSLKTSISRKSFHNSFKIAIINPSRHLTTEAANAFLKMLEEPPPLTIFILVSESLSSMLPTVVSRSEIICFSRVKNKDILPLLNNIYSKEQKQFIVRMTSGQIGKALTLNVEQIKHIIEQEKQILRIIKAPIYEKFILLEPFISSQQDILREKTKSIIRDILLMRLGMEDHIVHYYAKPELKKLASKFPTKKLREVLSELQNVTDAKKNNLNPQLFWNSIFLALNT